MKFRLITILWLFALLASAMGTFGPWGGLACAAIVLGVRQWIHAVKPAPIEYAVVIGIVLTLAALLLPAVQVAHSPSRRSMSLNQLKQLSLALHNYHDAHGRFPPPYTVDEDGNKLHSWRTLVLPHVEERGLYRQVKLDQPWDSPANKALFDQHPLDFMQSLRNGFETANPHETHYLAVVGENTLWTPDSEVSVASIEDGTSQTIALLEVPSRGVLWFEPRDLTVDEAVDLLTSADSEPYVRSTGGFFSSTHYRYQGTLPRLVAFADGRAMCYGYVQDEETARALLTVSGNEEIDAREYVDRSFDPDRVWTVIHWGRIWSLSLFALLSLMPWKREAPEAETTPEPEDAL